MAKAAGLLDSDEKSKLLDSADSLRNDAVTARLAANTLEENWGPGGTYRQVVTAFSAAAGGDVTGATSEFVQRGVVNWLQSNIATDIKQLAEDYGIDEGTPAHAALHAVSACLGANTAGSDCGSGALGAASAVFVSALLESQRSDELTNEQQEGRNALIQTLVVGASIAASVDAAAANTAALIELENNSNFKKTVKDSLAKAKDFAKKNGEEGLETLVEFLDSLEVKSLAEKKAAIEKYIEVAATSGRLSEPEIAALAIVSATNELFFPTSVLDASPLGKVKRAGVLVKNGYRPQDAARIVQAERRIEPVKSLANSKMLGENGVQTASKTVWKGEGKARIDVENPNPGQRPGQIHYQDNAGNKYLYNPEARSFSGAPRAINRLLEDKNFESAIEKAMKKYLGE